MVRCHLWIICRNLRATKLTTALVIQCLVFQSIARDTIDLNIVEQIDCNREKLHLVMIIDFS